jgi:predicted unusual protein kinase regulating ubiquinone biosynthesis (AarF/ABC1/UbiB family)
MRRIPLVLRTLRLGQIALREWRALRRFTRLPFEQRARHAYIPQRFAATLLALGPLAIKFGQILSTRPDLLPEEYIQTLAILHEHVPPIPLAEVEGMVRAAFGKDVSQIFAAFDPVPIASASVAQVHFAVLPSGAEVAVKVQRPQVRAQLERDLRVLERMLGLARHVFPRPVARLNLVDGFAEFKRYTLQELDFVQEGRTLDRFRANFQGWEDVSFPEVAWDYTTTVFAATCGPVGASLRSSRRSMACSSILTMCGSSYGRWAGVRNSRWSRPTNRTTKPSRTGWSSAGPW